MRLIDADKLPWVDRVILVDQVDGDINITIAKEHTSYVNDETPTVKAIPIEWMKKFANERALNDGMDGYWHFWGTDLLQMIELWEKENEID